MTPNALPMSRTKWVFKGPVSGTAAGRPAYQPAGSASIQIAFAALPNANTTSTHHQGSLRSAMVRPPSIRLPCGAGRRRSPATRARRGLAHDDAEARNALGDRVRCERGERQRQMIAAAPVVVD